MATNDNASKTFLALPDSSLQKSESLLQVLLANSLFMQSLYKKYHWHVDGKDFYQYHLLFDKHAGEQTPIIDLVGERLRTIGCNALGMPEDVVANKTLSEPTDAGHDPAKMVNNLLVCHENYIHNLREAVKITGENNDLGTNDLLVSDVLRVHELELWFVRSCV
jgi:starvation-inducible DNA-binding protein